MIIRLSLAVRNARATAIRDALDAGADSGYISFYTASQPLTNGAAITDQILLGTCTLSKPSGEIAEGALTFNAILDDDLADATGDIAWVRFFDGDDVFVFDADAGDESSDALVKINTVSTQQGGVIKVSLGILTEGNL